MVLCVLCNVALCVLCSVVLCVLLCSLQYAVQFKERRLKIDTRQGGPGVDCNEHTQQTAPARQQKTKDRLRNKCKDNTVLIAIGAYYNLYLDSGQQKNNDGSSPK